MVSNQSAFRIFSSIDFETIRVRGKKNNKTWFCYNFLHFQIVKTFGNLEIGFSIKLNKYFWIMINTFRVTLLLNLKFDTLWNKFEECRCHAVVPRVLPDMYLFLLKVLLSKIEGILSYVGLKKSYFTWQNMIVFNS